MDGAFPHHSISTPFIKQHHAQVYHYRNSMDESNVMKYSISSSSSSNSSRQSYSPPISSTPQRVPRKPVSNNPHNEWKTLSPALSSSPASRQRNYHAADTIHPNRMKIHQVSPIIKPVQMDSIISSSSPLPSTAEKYIRTRRHSQGSSLLSKPTFWYPRVDNKDNEPLQPLKRGLSKKIRGLLQPHRAQIEQGASKQQYEKDFQDSLRRSRTPDINYDQNPFHILRLVD